MWDGIVDTFLNSKLPSWVHKDERAYKKGGKVKKAKKSKTPAMSQNVKVNVKIGDSVLLRKGNAPRRSNPGVAKRFLSPGSAFGGGLPAPLSSLSYASAPQVAQPLGRLDFINAGDGVLNRGRDRRDDIPINVNPAGIRADVNPSIRYQPSSNSNAIQHAPAPIESSLPFQGRQPRLNMPDTSPSMNAVPPPIRIPRESPISSIFSSSVSGAGLSEEEADILYGTEGGRRLSMEEASARRRGTVFDESASAKPAVRSNLPASRIAPKKKPERGDLSPPALRRGGTVF
jgi:hypothetical protein